MLRGRVFDSQGRPAPHLPMVAISPESEGHSYSDEAGSFALDSLEPGPSLLFAFEAGRGSALLHLVSPPKEIDLRLDAPRFLAGTIRDGEGRALPGLSIQACPHIKAGPRWVEFFTVGGGKNTRNPAFPRLTRVHTPYDFPFAKTDREGRFSLELPVLLPRIVLEATRSTPLPSGSISFESAYALVATDRPAELAFTPTNSDPYLDLLEEAPESPEEALARMPNWSQRQGAESMLRDAHKRWPEHTGILERLAATSGSLGNHEGARAALDRWLTLRPRDPKPWLWRACNRWALKDLPAAEAAFSEAAFLDPALSHRRAIFRAITGNIAGAKDDRMEARRQASDLPQRALTLADVAILTGDPAAALREIEPFIGVRRFGRYALELRSKAKEALGDFQGALKDVELALVDLPYPDWQKDLEERRDALRRRLSPGT
jgi:hypothetical protein